MKRFISLLFAGVLGALVFGVVTSAATVFAADLVEKHIDVTFGNQTSDRTYFVYRPDACAEKQCPLLFMFHGNNPFYNTIDVAKFTAENYGWQAVADANDFIAVFPKGLVLNNKSFLGMQYDVPGQTGPSQRWDIAPIPTYNPFGYTFNATQDTKFVETIIDKMQQEYDILMTHIFSTGHSHGGFFSYYVSMYLNETYNDRFIKAFAVHSAGIAQYYGVSWPPNPWSAVGKPQLATPAYIIYSGKDPIIPAEWPVRMANYMNNNGHPATLVKIADSFGHLWDGSKMQAQWDFFMANSPEPPEEPVEPPVEEPAYAGFAEAFGVVYEGTSADVSVNLEGAGDDTVKVLVSVDAGKSTAKEGVDFEMVGNGVLEFAPGETQKSVHIEMAKDSEEEIDESIVLKLEILEGYAVLGEKSEHVQTLVDMTEPYYTGFVAENDSGDEQAAEYSVTLRADGKGSGSVTFNVYADPSSTATEGVDFSIPEKTFTVEDGGGDSFVVLKIYEDELDEEHETVVLGFEVVDGYAEKGGWLFETYTYTILNDDEPAPPPPAEPYWYPKFLTVLQKYTGVIWENEAEANLALLFDYGVNSTQLYEPFVYGPYDSYDIMDAEVSWKSPTYFWWGAWKKFDGKMGLYRRSSTEDFSLDKVVYFDDHYDLAFLDFALDKNGNPYVLLESDKEYVVLKYDQNGVKLAEYVYSGPEAGWRAKHIVVDAYGRMRILWVNGDKFFVDTIRVLANKTNITTTGQFAVPEGYEVFDFDRGWRNADQTSRVMFVDETMTKATIWKLTMAGTIKGKFNFVSPDGYKFAAMEGGSDNRIYLMLAGEEGSEAAQVWKINPVTGIVVDIREYSM